MEPTSTYQKVKQFIFTVIFLLLLARFIVVIGDAAFVNPNYAPNQVLALYTEWRSVITYLYIATGWLMLPIYLIEPWLWSILPPGIQSWFPALNGQQMIATVLGNPAMQPLHAGFQDPQTQKYFAGQFQFDIILGIVFYKLLEPLLDAVVDFFKNIIWNILIEFSFTQKKQALYQRKLEDRAADILKLKVEYKNLSKEASKLAETVITDELTSLYNKRFFLKRVEEEFNAAKNNKTLFSIVMVDIDHFKKLNDNYGHLMGDKVLKDVAGQVKSGTPKGCYACRFGGEEFSVIMPGVGPEEALKIATAIHQQIPQLRYTEDPKLQVTISMGMLTADFANSPSAAELSQFDDAIKLADDELYRAKLNGRNRIEHNVMIT